MIEISSPCLIVLVGPAGCGKSTWAAANFADHVVSSDDLRALDDPALISRTRDAATVALRGTGFSHLVDILVAAHPGVVVLDPLAVALTRLSG